MNSSIHFRRCHICNLLNEQENDSVHACTKCGQQFAPFFYFDDRFTTIPTDGNCRPETFINEYRPIEGLTVYWDGEVI